MNANIRPPRNAVVVAAPTNRDARKVALTMFPGRQVISAVGDGSRGRTVARKENLPGMDSYPPSPLIRVWSVVLEGASVTGRRIPKLRGPTAATVYRDESGYRIKAAEVDRTDDCAVCGFAFLHLRTDAVYCSPTCRQKAYRERVTAKRNAEGTHR